MKISYGKIKKIIQEEIGDLGFSDRMKVNFALRTFEPKDQKKIVNFLNNTLGITADEFDAIQGDSQAVSAITQAYNQYKNDGDIDSMISNLTSSLSEYVDDAVVINEQSEDSGEQDLMMSGVLDGPWKGYMSTRFGQLAFLPAGYVLDLDTIITDDTSPANKLRDFENNWSISTLVPYVVEASGPTAYAASDSAFPYEKHPEYGAYMLPPSWTLAAKALVDKADSIADYLNNLHRNLESVAQEIENARLGGNEEEERALQQEMSNIVRDLKNQAVEEGYSRSNEDVALLFRSVKTAKNIASNIEEHLV